MAVRLLDAAGATGAVGGERPAGAGLGAVTLGPSGAVDVRPPQAGDTTPVSELLEQLLENVRLPAHPRPQQQLLLRELEEAARDPLPDPGARARELERVLAESLGPDAQERLSGQLAALVDAFRHVAPAGAAAPAVAAAPAATASPLPSSRRAAPERNSAPPRRAPVTLRRRTAGRRVALVALILVAALAGTGYLVLRGSGMGILESLGPGTQPAAPPTTLPDHASRPAAKKPQSPRAQAVPALARRHAGPVTGVVVEKAGTCTPGTLCSVKVTVHLRPDTSSRLVGWKVGAVRLCKRSIVWSPPTAMTAQPGWTTVYAHSAVRVPKGHSLALVALTTAPARAQSRPVPVTGSSLHC